MVSGSWCGFTLPHHSLSYCKCFFSRTPACAAGLWNRAATFNWTRWLSWTFPALWLGYVKMKGLHVGCTLRRWCGIRTAPGRTGQPGRGERLSRRVSRKEKQLVPGAGALCSAAAHAHRALSGSRRCGAGTRTLGPFLPTLSPKVRKRNPWTSPKDIPQLIK